MSPFRKAMPSWGSWIRDYLLGLPDKEDYVFSIYKKYNENLKDNNYAQISFSSFVGYIWLLVKLGGLERTRDEPVSRQIAGASDGSLAAAAYADKIYTIDIPPKMTKFGMRHYYQVVPGSEHEGFWDSPRLKWSVITGKPRG